MNTTTVNKVYKFPEWGLEITAKNDIIAEIAKYVHLNNEGRTRPLSIMDIEVPDDIAKYIIRGEERDTFIFEGIDGTNGYDEAVALQLLLLENFVWIDNTNTPDNSGMTSWMKFHYALSATGKIGVILNWDVSNDTVTVPILDNYEIYIYDSEKFNNKRAEYNMDGEYIASHADYL